MLIMMASLSEARAQKKSGHPVSAPGGSSLPQLGKLREAMMTWYCPTHSELTPCKTFLFMKGLRETKSPEEKKKLLLDRQNKMSAMSAEEKKVMQTQAREAFRIMYTEYCRDTQAIALRNAEVCTNTALKNLYGEPQG